MHTGLPDRHSPLPTGTAYHRGTPPPPGHVATPGPLTWFTWSQGTLSARPFHLGPWLLSLDERALPPQHPPADVQALYLPSPSPMTDSPTVCRPHSCLCTALALPVPSIHNSHVLSDRGIADSVGGGWDAGLAAVAATTAVQTGHVHSVKAVVCLPWPWSSLLFSILIRASAGRDSAEAQHP